jgi:hypothetical protein
MILVKNCRINRTLSRPIISDKYPEPNCPKIAKTVIIPYMSAAVATSTPKAATQYVGSILDPDIAAVWRS